MARTECHACQKDVGETDTTCPHCGAPVQSTPAAKPKKWYERTSVTLCVAAVLVVIGFGFVHVITGVTSPHELPVDIVRKESFGFRETFVNADRIRALPVLAARAKYPLGCEVLQRCGYLPSGRRFEARVRTRLRVSLRRWQEQFDKALGRAEVPWEERFRGEAAPADAAPESAAAYNQRGIALARTGQYQAALAAFSRAIRKAPAHIDAYHNRALVYVAIGNVGQAASDIGRVVEIKPDFVEGYLQAGRLHLSVDAYDEALVDFTRAIEIDSRCSEAYFKRAIIHYAQAKYGQAWRDVRKVTSLGVAIPSGFIVALEDASDGPDS